jgi:uncharacterized protein
MRDATQAEAAGPPAVHVLVKPVGAACNLGCEYCFYLGKRALYPQGTFRMAGDLLEEFTRQYIASQRVPEVTFSWQGGEPTLMGLDFFRRAVELQRQYGRPGTRIANAIQTNGTLLDDDWCEFLRANDFLVGISLDGPRHLHDQFRRDRDGNPTFERVMAGVHRLLAQDVQFNILACVSAANVEQPLEVYRFLRDEAKARFIQFIPIVERDNAAGCQQGNRVTHRSVTGAQYGDFLISVFDEWVRRDVGRVFVQLFDVALAACAGQPATLCVFSPTCGSALAMEHNGDLYACDHFVEPDHLLGNIMDTPLEELAGSPQQRQFGLAKQESLPSQCQRCDVRFACHGGCPKNRLLRTEDGEDGLNYLCTGYQAFFRHIDQPMRFMVAQLHGGRPPANIMLHLAARQMEQQGHLLRTPRNAPCPCGSGRKVKHCCGRAVSHPV